MSADRREFLTAAAGGALLLGCSRSSTGATARAAGEAGDDGLDDLAKLTA